MCKHPFCKVCGWRKGGADSWDGSACKCGHYAPPLTDADGVALDALCRCGHQNGDHRSGGTHECLGRFGEGGCSCRSFQATR